MLLWADTGTGKTAAAIECAKRVGARRVLYLCPAILKNQVKSEADAWWPEADASVVQGTKPMRAGLWASDARFLVSNYEQLQHDLDAVLAYAPDMVVVDECQRLAAPTSKTLKAFRKLDPAYRLAMSGTPAPNALHEFWNMTDWVSPGHFHRTFWEFRSRECRMLSAFPKILGYYDKDKVQSRFMAKVHRVRREDVLELPPLVEVRVPCALGKKQREAYERLKAELRLELASGQALTVPNALALLMRLRQMTDLPEALGVDAPSAKTEALAELLDSVSSRKVIVFTEFASVARHLEWKYRSEAVAVTGDTPQGARDAIFERFRSDPKIRLLFLTSAAQYGVNLQAADAVVHYDLPWNDARVDQRVARAWRYGQERPVTSYRIVAEDTVDVKMERLIEGKRKATVEELMRFFD